MTKRKHRIKLVSDMSLPEGYDQELGKACQDMLAFAAAWPDVELLCRTVYAIARVRQDHAMIAVMTELPFRWADYRKAYAERERAKLKPAP